MQMKCWRLQRFTPRNYLTNKELMLIVETTLSYIKNEINTNDFISISKSLMEIQLKARCTLYLLASFFDLLEQGKRNIRLQEIYRHALDFDCEKDLKSFILWELYAPHSKMSYFLPHVMPIFQKCANINIESVVYVGGDRSKNKKRLVKICADRVKQGYYDKPLEEIQNDVYEFFQNRRTQGGH